MTDGPKRQRRPGAAGQPEVPEWHHRELSPHDLGRDVYGYLNAVVVPRPIAWVSSISAAGTANLAPHSYFTVASVAPPVVQFTSIGRKDSLRNIEETGEFVVHLSPYGLREQINLTGTNFPPEVDEFAAAGLRRALAVVVKVPRVAQSPVALECRLAGTREFGRSTVVFGEVVHLAVAEEVLRNGVPDLRALDPVARLGGDDWGRLGEVFALRRVPYADYQREQDSSAG